MSINSLKKIKIFNHVIKLKSQILQDKDFILIPAISQANNNTVHCKFPTYYSPFWPSIQSFYAEIGDKSTQQAVHCKQQICKKKKKITRWAPSEITHLNARSFLCLWSTEAQAKQTQTQVYATLLGRVLTPTARAAAWPGTCCRCTCAAIQRSSHSRPRPALSSWCRCRHADAYASARSRYAAARALGATIGHSSTSSSTSSCPTGASTPHFNLRRTEPEAIGSSGQEKTGSPPLKQATKWSSMQGTAGQKFYRVSCSEV
jgi:hypothetical protein